MRLLILLGVWVSMVGCSFGANTCSASDPCPGGGICDPSGFCLESGDSGTGGGSTGGGTGGATGGGATGGGTGGGATGGGTGGGSTGGGTGGGGATGGGAGGGSTGGGSGGGGSACTPGVECRARNGECDLPEICDGSGSCPADAPVAAGIVCRAPAGLCDPDERCDGISTQCPADLLFPGTTVCRTSAGTCDPQETCTGSSPQCPADVLAPDNSECRPAAGVCDVPESCTGSSAICPADSFVGAGIVCRATAGACDVPESCSGGSPTCPADLLLTAGTTCRIAVNLCDLAETCNGTQSSCPSDAYQPSTFECAAQSCSAGVTTPARLCAGASATCNAATTVSCNGYQCNGATCRTSCITSADCLSTHFCQPGSQCAPKRIDGQPCTGASNGFECVSGVCTGSYTDSDGDNYGTGLLGYFCGSAASAGRSLNNTDCCDSDARARPGAATYQTTARTTCGGFDFNCDGATTIQYPGANACTEGGTCSAQSLYCTGPGWSGAEAACGESKSYVTVCNDMPKCAPSVCTDCIGCGQPTTVSRTQGCR